MNGKLASLFFTFAITISISSATKEYSQLLDLIMANYDRRVRPYYQDKPLQVDVNAYILDFFNIDESSHEFSVQLYFRQHWRDPRLNFSGIAKNIDRISLDPENAKKIWIPDTFILNERKSSIHALTTLNEFTKIEPNGQVLRSSRLSVTASCKMTLYYFPFDKQTCTLEIESYGFTASDFFYKWKDGKKSIGISETVSSLNFALKGFNTKESIASVSTGNYSRLAMEFFLVREKTKYIQDIYFPIIVLTLLSFITLWTGTLQSRVQMSVLIMIAMILFTGFISNTLPRASYQTALDMYLFICINLSFNVVLVNILLEYFYSSNKTEKIQMRGMGPNDNRNNGDDEMKESLCDDFQTPMVKSRTQEIIYGICVKSKVSLPVSFLVINVIYWMVVLIGSSGFPEDFLIREDHS